MSKAGGGGRPAGSGNPLGNSSFGGRRIAAGVRSFMRSGNQDLLNRAIRSNINQ